MSTTVSATASTPESITNTWIKEVNFRLFEESVPRIKKCLAELSEEEVWQRPNDNLSSIGNLVLHLMGNVTQYVVHGIGGAPDDRIRDDEFNAQSPFDKAELISRLEKFEEAARQALTRFKPTDLERTYSIQGFDLTGISVLTHVVEHFSYHTGQITWYTKFLKNKDMGYYGGLDLNVTG
ncbi:MAG: DinB family protein [Bacteroidota bacterium]